MTRMIERWFPCTEVSANSRSGWGSGNAEAAVMTWFAKRPTSQAKAATICSLLPWPDDELEQEELQKLVQEAMTGRDAARAEIRERILSSNPHPVSTLDPFSGRGMIPFESSRLGIVARAIDYSPVAVMASRLLTVYPAREWDHEPELRFGESASTLLDPRPRLVQALDAVFSEVEARHIKAMAPYFPEVNGRRPWGHLWAVTLPCAECANTFPLIGSLQLRQASTRRTRGGQPAFHDPGQSYYIETDSAAGTWSVVIHNGPPRRSPTRQVPPGKSPYDSNGRLAVCPFCGNAHDREQQMRILRDSPAKDAPLLAADLDDEVGKRYRPLEPSEITAISQASTDLASQPRFGVLLSARPDEAIPAGNTWTVQATVYGTRTYGDMMNDRQTLSFVTICRIINDIAQELTAAGCSDDYVRALTGYAAAVMSRKIRRATRGCTLDISRSGVHDLFATESSLNFSFDYFEVGIAGGPGSWDSVSTSTLRSVAAILPAPGSAEPCDVEQGSATSVMLPDRSVTAVITDPPYDAMIDYTDASDLSYVWIKRALASSWPEIGITPRGDGLQDKSREIIVKKGGTSNNDHRNRKHYDTLITEAFTEAQRVVSTDGVVTIVFGHGEPEVWQRLLAAIENSNLVLTAAWPAKTEQGGKVGFSNIVTTLTMACRPAPDDRLPGRKGVVDNLIRAEIKRRYPDWERWGLAPADMLMSAAGPAMEVVGRYSQVLDAKGEKVDIHTFLPLARAAVQEVMAVEVDNRPLDTFDARTRFALWWVRLYGRQIQPRSELRWQALASSMDSHAVRDLITPAEKKGVAFTTSSRFKAHITSDSSVIDVVLALAAASEDSVTSMGEVLAASGRTSDDPFLWAAVKFLANRLPSSDPDGMALTRVLRTRDAIANAANAIVSKSLSRRRDQKREDLQLKLL